MYFIKFCTAGPDSFLEQVPSHYPAHSAWDAPLLGGPLCLRVPHCAACMLKGPLCLRVPHCAACMLGGPPCCSTGPAMTPGHCCSDHTPVGLSCRGESHALLEALPLRPICSRTATYTDLQQPCQPGQPTMALLQSHYSDQPFVAQGLL